jgi:hypothetical protein
VPVASAPVPVSAPELVEPVAVPVPSLGERPPVVAAARPEASVLTAPEPERPADDTATVPVPKTTARRAAPRAARTRKTAESADEGASSADGAAEPGEPGGEQRTDAGGDGSAA